LVKILRHNITSGFLNYLYMEKTERERERERERNLGMR
jgi:hypothetical protein